MNHLSQNISSADRTVTRSPNAMASLGRIDGDDDAICDV
jgi:hypothetical protein